MLLLYHQIPAEFEEVMFLSVLFVSATLIAFNIIIRRNFIFFCIIHKEITQINIRYNKLLLQVKIWFPLS